MRNLRGRLAALTPVLAVSMGGAAAASGGGEESRSLALSVVEGESDVELELISNAAADTRVEYEIELIGNSRARHAGNTQLTGGERHVLSRLRANFSESWCATVNVTEADGTTYTLTAGDCE